MWVLLNKKAYCDPLRTLFFKAVFCFLVSLDSLHSPKSLKLCWFYCRTKTIILLSNKNNGFALEAAVYFLLVKNGWFFETEKILFNYEDVCNFTLVVCVNEVRKGGTVHYTSPECTCSPDCRVSRGHLLSPLLLIISRDILNWLLLFLHLYLVTMSPTAKSKSP